MLSESEIKELDEEFYEIAVWQFKAPLEAEDTKTGERFTIPPGGQIRIVDIRVDCVLVQYERHRAWVDKQKMRSAPINFN